MTGSTRTYIAFAVTLGIGMWLILTFGKSLQAPSDLHGTWSLEGNKELRIEQSGKFFAVHLPDRPTLNLRLAEETSGTAMIHRILKGDGTTLKFDTGEDRKSAFLELDGPQPGKWSATRVSTTVASQKPKPAPAKASGGHERFSSVFILLLQIGVILGLGKLMGFLAQRVHQPNVVGEMVAGIMLGPSLFGAFFPEAAAFVFPASSIVYLSVLAQIGVIMFLFLVGLELDPKLISDRGHAAVVISHASIIAPFLLGAAITLFLYPLVFNNTQFMQFTPVALFMGAAMSITAFPVLARILTERNLHKTKVGAVAITCAAVDDVTAWCMLAFVVAVAQAEGLKPGLITAGFSLTYVVAMFFLVRPFLKRLEDIYDRQGRLSQGVVAIVLLLVLASAAITELIGIHALFGAFLMGAMMPKGSKFIRALSEKLEDFTILFLLPIFFAFAGLKTQIGLINTPYLWAITFGIIIVACLGKFGGSMIAAQASGLHWRESAAIGILMNTRGLMELVILTIGLQLGVITQAVFAMMVIMALVTTALTTPILHVIYPPRFFRNEGPNVDAATAEKEFGVLVPVSLPATGPALARLADLVSVREEAARKIYALHLSRAQEYDAYRAPIEETLNGTPDELAPLIDEAKKLSMASESISFVSREVATDITRVAGNKKADLTLMGYHKPVFGRTLLGGVVNQVLTMSTNDVAVFIDRGLGGLNRLLVPYKGGKNDVLALQLAARIAINSGARITILNARPEKDPDAAKHQPVKVAEAVSSSLIGKVDIESVGSMDSVDAVIERSKNAQLVVVGMSEEWGTESQYFGLHPERLAEASQASLLLVQKTMATPS